MKILFYWILINNINNNTIEILSDSFEKWTNASSNKILFKRTEKEIDFENYIYIKFYSREHELCKPFDGPKGVLAHFSPLEYKNNYFIHFDSDENWCFEKNSENCLQNTTNFLSVSLHEIGHVLGLKHSNNKNSIMYKNYNKKTQISIEDTIKLEYILTGNKILNLFWFF